MQEVKFFLRISLVLLLFFIQKRVAAQNNLCQAGKMSAAPVYFNAENLRSDTFNILKYTINLEVGTATNKFIAGNTKIRFAPKLNNRTFIRFDLLKLIIDSVKENSSSLTHTYNDTVLKINFLIPKNIIDTSVITIYYHGQPQLDASWGGFYFNAASAQYAYNLGVGFTSKPHNFGRVWFPCFDNFVERSKYEFNITSDTARRAQCNGQLTADVITANKRTRTWVLNEEIPSYLACVSVANYRTVNWTIPVINGNKPITLTAAAADTSAVKAGFVNLKSCIHGFENYYGPYMWNRFGYVVVPFNGGAMEHVTNIAYPRFAIGNINYEDLMAHELSHHWWGDLLTCETPEDMWINEGMASFSAFLFFEWQYGKQNYLNRVKTEHDALLQFLHKNEGGFRAVSGVPHTLTYGDHVYKKGADIAHTLRGYLGDSAFFAGAKYTLQQKAYKSMNSTEFQNLMQIGSGQNTVDFFNNWVFTGGWSHFGIDSVTYQQISPGTVQCIVALKQKTYGTSILHSNVPLELSFFKSDWSRVVRKVLMNGATSSFTVTLPYIAVYYALNYDSKINDASSHEYKVIKSNGALSWTLGKIPMQVLDKGLDSSLVRVIHNYVKPDPFKNNPANHKLSDQHFWKVEGLLSAGFVATARFNYNGNKVLSGPYGYMDTLLTGINGDSVSLFYRRDAADDWKLLRNVYKVKNSSRSGYFDIDTLKLGEYTFGNSTDLTYLGLKPNDKKESAVKIYPNPAKNSCTVELRDWNQKETTLIILSNEGKLIQERKLIGKLNNVDLSHLTQSSYLFKVVVEGKTVFQQKMVIE